MPTANPVPIIKGKLHLDRGVEHMKDHTHTWATCKDQVLFGHYLGLCLTHPTYGHICGKIPIGDVLLEGIFYKPF